MQYEKPNFYVWRGRG